MNTALPEKPIARKRVYPRPVLGLLVVFSVLAAASGAEEREAKPSFTNPCYPGADPWVIGKDGFYYLCRSERDLGISVWKSRGLTDRGDKKVVWNAPEGGWNARQVWAPELHYLQGCWYIYYAASDGDNRDHRMGVLEALGEDPQGPYRDRGMLYTGDDIESRTHSRWAIDGTVLELGGRLYFIWSGWPAEENVQYLYIARMENPWSIASHRVRLCENDTYIWERVAEDPSQRGLHEGPEILKRHSRVFLVYSCSGSWEVTYKLGMLWMDESADPMDPASWTKHPAPVFRGTEKVLGVGHASFTRSPDGSEDWIIFHSKTSRRPGWLDRKVWMQKFGWTEEGFPDFGTPVAAGVPLPLPSGEEAKSL